jgi:cytochrome P450
MLKYPDIQRKAQKELDAKVGRDRLPDYQDKEKLPYIDAVIKEITRWHPNIPLESTMQ